MLPQDMILFLTLFDPSWPFQEEAKQQNGACEYATCTETQNGIWDNTANSTLKQLSEVHIWKNYESFSFLFQKT